MNTTNQPTVVQTMMFRVSAERAFQAFVDPAVTARFWFSHSDGALEEGKQVTWEWRPYGCSCHVEVIAIEPSKRIVIKWGDANESSIVEWIFDARSENATLVTIQNSNFVGTTDPVSAAIDSMGGFSLVLANAKAFLEHGLELNLIYDKAPDAIAN